MSEEIKGAGITQEEMDEYLLVKEKETKFPAVEIRPVIVDDHEVEGYQAIYNPDTEHTFDITSKKYKLVKHEDVLAKVESVLDTNPAFGNYTRNVRLYKQGARMRTTYTFDKEIVVQVEKGDLIRPTLDVFGSYDRSSRHILILGAMRVVCTNGQVVGEKFAYIRQRHMPDLDLDDVNIALKTGIVALEEQKLTWEKWQDMPLEMDTYHRVMKALALNKKETALLMEEHEQSTHWSLDRWISLLDMPGEKYEKEARGLNKYTFFNILTQFMTHRISSEARRVQLEEKARRVLY